MLKVLTAEQMREVDRLTTEKYGIPSILLMENAAHAAARVITEKLGGSVKNERFIVLCGKGNNGGDGAALARVLWTQGASCFVYLAGSVEDTKGDARTNFEILRQISEGPIPGINENCLFFDEVPAEEFVERLEVMKQMHCNVLVDSMFGTGLARPVEGPLNEFINIHGRSFRREWFVVSLDIPSGLMSDTHRDFTGVKSHLTVTFTAPKPALIMPGASDLIGELEVVKIGTPDELLDASPSQLFVAERMDVKYWLRESRFTNDSYKNKRGHALIIAGSKNYTGAAVLCGDAAIRSGVGLTTLAVPEGSRESVVARVSPEVMVRGISESPDGSAGEKAFDDVMEFSQNVDVIAVGSGLSSKEAETRAFIRKVVTERTTPVVIDADGLTALSPFDLTGSDELPLVLTPHEGEFMKLLGTDDKSVISDRVQAVRDFAVKHKVILVLKGERVLIGEPGGNVIVNPTGNPGLGKAGNGDTLTGIITGFAAQAMQMKIDMFETVVAAVYIASFAGDLAEKKYGKRVMTASDVRECLSETFSIMSGDD